MNDGEDGDILHVPGAQTEHQDDHGNSNIVSTQFQSSILTLTHVKSMSSKLQT